MSDLRLINPRSPEWIAIVDLLQRRIGDLTEEAMSPTLSDQQRRDAVMRADELGLLLRAPAEMTDKLLRENSEPTPRTIY